MRLSNLRVGAQGGGSGCRNDVLNVMGEVKGGIRCLRDWAQLWAEGRVPPCVVVLLVGQVLRPVKKDNGKPRNISLMEVERCE